jgi:hypothetical protein
VQVVDAPAARLETGQLTLAILLSLMEMAEIATLPVLVSL